MKKSEIEILWESMKTQLNEMQRRQYAAALANAYGYGGSSVIHKVTGISMNTITAGKKELKGNREEQRGSVRKSGGGPKWTEEKYPDVKECVKAIVDGSTYGNPEKVLSWTTESLRSIQKELNKKYGINISYVTVGAILEDIGYSKQANQKMLQVGKPHPDRNAQFENISDKAKSFIEAHEPVISVDTKKKENIGNFKNPGKEYGRSVLKRAESEPEIANAPPRFRRSLKPSFNRNRYIGQVKIRDVYSTTIFQ